MSNASLIDLVVRLEVTSANLPESAGTQASRAAGRFGGGALLLIMSLFQVDPERIRRTTGTLWVRVDNDPLKERGEDKQYASLTKLPFWQAWKQYFVLLKTEEEPAELRWFVDRNETVPVGVIVLDQIARGLSLIHI